MDGQNIRWPWTPISELQLASGGGELGIRLCSGTISAKLVSTQESTKWQSWWWWSQSRDYHLWVIIHSTIKALKEGAFVGERTYENRWWFVCLVGGWGTRMYDCPFGHWLLTYFLNHALPLYCHSTWGYKLWTWLNGMNVGNTNRLNISWL